MKEYGVDVMSGVELVRVNVCTHGWLVAKGGMTCVTMMSLPCLHMREALRH